MISTNHRPDYCRDFRRNRDSVMILDEIADSFRDRRATLRLGGGGMTEYWGGTIHFFLLTFYNFKNIGGHVPPPPPCPPYSAVPEFGFSLKSKLQK